MAELKVTKKVDYTVGGVKRTAEHNAVLSYETTKVGGATVLDMKSLSVTGSYGGSGAGTDGSNGGKVTLVLDGRKLIDTSDTFGAASATSTAEALFTQKRHQALQTSDYYGARWVPSQLQYTKKLTVAVSVYNPATGKEEWASSEVAITIPGTGIVPIKGKPTAKVVKLSAPTRATGGSRTMTSTWDYPATMSANTNAYRAGSIRLAWVVSTGRSTNKTKKGSIKGGSKHSGLTLKTASLNLGSFSLNGKQYTRTSFYPGTAASPSTLTINAVSLSVIGVNAKGEGPAATVTRKFQPPVKPSVSAISQDEATGKVSVTITADPGNGYRERYDTRVQMTVYDTSKPKDKRTVYKTDQTFTGTRGTLSYDIPNRSALGASNYIKVTVKAWSRGLAGYSETTSKESYISWPLRPSIKSISIPSAKTEEERLASHATVSIATAATKEHPVTGIKLEALVDVPYANANSIPGNADWQETGAQDNGKCTAMAVAVGAINPATAGNHTWLRLKSWNAIEGIFKTYSSPVEVKALYHKAPTAADDTVRVVSVESGSDGKSAVVTLAWKNDDSTGTEVSWSADPDGWRSTNRPSTFEVTESDGPITVGSTTWAKSYVLHINGLTEDTAYYVRARRYLDSETTTYGAYHPSNGGMEVVPISTPDSCTINVPQYVRRGDSAEISWGHSGDNAQKSWELLSGNVAATTDTDGVVHYSLTGKLESVASGSGPVGSYVISADRLESLIGSGSGIYLAVKVSTSKMTTSYVQSEAKMLKVADAPELEITSATVTQQPMEIAAICDMESDLSIVVRADGADGDWPSGPRAQLAGDVIWSGLVRPEWVTESVNRENILTNRPEAWERSTIDSNGLVTESPYVVSLRPEQAIPVAAGQYTLSMANSSGYKAMVTAYKNEEIETDECKDWTATFPLAIDITDANSIIVRLCHSDNSVMLPSELGDSAKVQLELGSSASTWGLPSSDAKELSATVTMPTGLDLWDGAGYTVTATASARDTGLRSDEATATFGVDWERDAPAPSDLTTVDVSDEMDSEGRRVRSALITLSEPTGAASGDVCDIYRVTPDGPQQLIAGVPVDAVVYDQWAPFGGTDLAYRVAVRTVDGAVSWADIGYDFDSADVFSRVVRIDYGDGYFELDRNVTYDEGYEKGFEARKHLDGSAAGYWESGVMRTASASGIILAVYEADKEERLRELAAYTGPVFVRTSDGVAYEADAQVGNLAGSMSTAAVSVTLQLTEVRPTSYGGTIVEVGL